MTTTLKLGTVYSNWRASLTDEQNEYLNNIWGNRCVDTVICKGPIGVFLMYECKNITTEYELIKRYPLLNNGIANVPSFILKIDDLEIRLSPTTLKKLERLASRKNCVRTCLDKKNGIYVETKSFEKALHNVKKHLNNKIVVLHMSQC